MRGFSPAFRLYSRGYLTGMKHFSNVTWPEAWRVTSRKIRRLSVPCTLALASAAFCNIWATTPAQVPSFVISTIAGNGSAGYSGDGGKATAAELNDPRGIVTDPAGNIYFCDRLNHVVRKIDLNGNISTIAGSGVRGYNGDNIPGTQAQLNTPWRVTIDPAGNLYIADSGNNRIRKLATNGIITTVAGNGMAEYSGDGGPATSAFLNFPEQAELDVFGNLYIADTYNNVIRKVNTSGTISTVAGTGSGAGNLACNGGYSGDNGPATKAQLNFPVSIALDPVGDLWISDQCNNVIREVNTNGVINTVAGIYNVEGYTGDGGPATRATFCTPAGIARDAAGNIYVTDDCNNVLRAVLTDGTIHTVAGNGTAGDSGDGGPATSAELNSLRQVAVGTFGDVYIADSLNNKIRKLTPTTIAIGQTTNAAGNVQVIAANTWITVKGTNLAPAGDTRSWQQSDFINGQMPTSLDGVSVTLNGINAYVSYISPSQVNALAPPNLQTGLVQVEVINNGVRSAIASVQLQSYSPAFFTLTYASPLYTAALHANGTIVGPASLYPGLSSPAQPGEIIEVYGTGFGPVTAAVTAGSIQQFGTLPVLPVFTIGGTAATVDFAGVVSPGLYQFNVVIPANTPAGDTPITATYNGFTTQAGTLVTVQ
jgi:uncharacterized protein (TIGR03437 family)